MVVLPEFMEAPRQAGYGFGASVTGAGSRCSRPRSR